MPPHSFPLPLTARHRSLLLFALALGGFAIGTSEFSPMGLMPELARGLGVSEPDVGHLISAYALGVVIGAPILAILGGRLPRRTLLLALMGFYIIAHLACALAPNYPTLLVFRFVAGLPHGGYFGVAALTAVAVSPPHMRGRAIGSTMLGLSTAILLGNPFTVWMGQWIGWRLAFVIVALVAMITAGLLLALLPRDSGAPDKRVMDELRAFNRQPVWQALAIGAIGFSGMFCVFSYLAPTMLHVTNVSALWIPLGMAGFGIGGLIGNLLGGWLFDTLRFRAVPVILLWAVGMLLLYPLAAHALWSILLVTIAIGIMGGLGVILQSHLMDVAGDAQTLAAASHHAAFNAANALGPWLGGLAISAGLGWAVTGPVGAASALAGMMVWLWAASGYKASRAPFAQNINKIK